MSDDSGNDAVDVPESDQDETALAVLTYVVKAIVDEPDAVSVEVSIGRSQRFDVQVAPDDMGRVIGRRGRTADAIRTLVNAAAALNGHKVDVEFVD